MDLVRTLATERLQQLVEQADCTTAGADGMARAVVGEADIRAWRPEPDCRVDPRDGMPIAYSMARARRPHDTGPPGQASAPAETPCPVCEGKTTGIVDVADAGRKAGQTFINKNLFPILYPHAADPPELFGRRAALSDRPASGTHLLQWTSNHHHLDLHNIGQRHMEVVLERLGALEGTLLHDGTRLPRVADGGHCREPHHGYVGIIKNYGHRVGGSLQHGHQQICHTSVRPLRIAQDMAFREREGRSVAELLIAENPAELTLRDYGPARLLTPHFLRRPLQAMLVLTDPSRSYLHELTGVQRKALARGLREMTAAVVALMPKLGRETAYNLVVHNGPVGGLYIELLPWTQEYGGYEQLGLFICQGTPEHSHRLFADQLGPA